MQKQLVSLMLILLVMFPSTYAQSEDFEESLDKIQEAAEKLNELIDKYKNAELDVIKTEDVTITDQNGNGVACTFEPYYNDYLAASMSTGADGKFTGNFNHGKHWPSGVISMRVFDCPCTIVSVQHDTTFPLFEEDINRIKGIISEEITDWVSEKGKDLAKQAVEKAFESVGAAELAGPFLWGVGAGAALGAPIGQFITEKVNEILEAQLRNAELAHKYGDVNFPPTSRRLTARWNVPIIEWFRTDPVIKNTWNIKVRCWQGNPVTAIDSTWEDPKEYTPQVTSQAPPSTTGTPTGPRESDAERAQRERDAQARREQEQRDREERERREREEKERQEKERQERERREREIQQKAEEVRLICPLCEPIRAQIEQTNKEINDKQAEIDRLQQEANAAADTLKRAQRSLENAQSQLNNFDNPQSWAESEGRRVDSSDLAVDRYAAQQNWQRYRSGEQTAQETSDNWRDYGPEERARAKEQYRGRLQQQVIDAQQAVNDAQAANQQAQQALGVAKQQLANLQKRLEQLKRDLEECLKKCKLYARQIAEGLITDAQHLLDYGEPVTPPKTTIRLLTDCDRYKAVLQKYRLTDTQYNSMDEAQLEDHGISETMQNAVEQYKRRCDEQTGVVQEEEKPAVTTGPVVTDTTPQQPQQTCSEYCSSKNMVTQPTDWTNYILGELNSKGVCASSASISTPGGIRKGDCTCYSAQQPTISVSSQKLYCRGTQCGDVACGSSAQCSCGTNCVVTVTCNWGGWRKVSDTGYQPVAGISS